MKVRFQRRILYILLILVDNIFLLIPYDVALAIGRFFGFLAYLILGEYRRLTKLHLKFAFGNSKDHKEISKIAKSVFVNLGMNAAEMLSIPKLKDRLDEIIDIKGLDKIDEVLKNGRGAIAISGHFGNWEFLPMYFAYKGYSSSVLARPIYYEKYNEWIMFLRRNMGVNVIYRTESPKKIIEPLKKNELLGILPDQDIDSIEGLFVDFFGKKAYTPVAPIKIAMATQAPLIPIVIVRNGKRHTIIADDPIKVVNVNQDREATILTYTQQWSNVLESYIREYPEQWVWMHRRWKTRPPVNS